MLVLRIPLKSMDDQVISVVDVLDELSRFTHVRMDRYAGEIGSRFLVVVVDGGPRGATLPRLAKLTSDFLISHLRWQDTITLVKGKVFPHQNLNQAESKGGFNAYDVGELRMDASGRSVHGNPSGGDCRLWASAGSDERAAA